MRYSLYIDRIFMTHFAINLSLLFLTAKSGGIDCKKRRIFGAAAAGAALLTAALAIPVPGLGRGMRLAVKGLCLTAFALLQIWFAFECRNGKAFRRAAMICGACICVMGGTLGTAGGLWEAFGQASVSAGKAAAQRKGLPDCLGTSAFCMTAAYAGWRVIAAQRRRSRSPLWKVTFLEAGERIVETGLLDSGNGLYDPYNRNPVCIIDPAEAKRLGIFEKNAPLRLIPYRCVGKKHGLLRAVIVDEMYLEKEGQEKRIGQVTLAVSPEPLSASGAYQVILHPALLEEKKGANHDLKSSDAGKHAV